MSYQLSAIPPSLIDYVWPVCIPYLERVIKLAPKELSLDVIRAHVMSGDATMCFVTQGEKLTHVITLEVRVFPSGLKAMYMPIVAGDGMEDCFDEILDKVKDAARTLGCHELRGLAARDGWLRRLKKEGWEQVHTVISCEI
jgi:hypothetical protein